MPAKRCTRRKIPPCGKTRRRPARRRPARTRAPSMSPDQAPRIASRIKLMAAERDAKQLAERADDRRMRWLRFWHHIKSGAGCGTGRSTGAGRSSRDRCLIGCAASRAVPRPEAVPAPAIRSANATAGAKRMAGCPRGRAVPRARRKRWRISASMLAGSRWRAAGAGSPTINAHA